MEKPLKPLGVILCGGESSRMGSDKSRLNYHGVSQREHLKKLLKPFCSGVVLSIGERQETAEECFSDSDPFKGSGPISGLLTLHHFFPRRDLLLVACDYPLLRRSDLNALLTANPFKETPVVFENPESHQAEPLIGLYPAGFCETVLSHWMNGEQSLRRILERHKTVKLVPENPYSLFSVDSPEQAAQARELIRRMPTFV